MPLLPLMMNYKDAAAIVFVLSIVVTSITFFRNRQHYYWRQGWELIAGAVVGLPVGFYVLVHADEALLRHLLGAAMCAFAANELIFERRRRGPGISARLGFPLGILSGGLDAAFNMGGPPAVAYVYSRPWSPQQIAASLQVLFGVGLALRLILFSGTGLLSERVLRTSAWACFR
jgi:uncharacterized membrane protein YfcA